MKNLQITPTFRFIQLNTSLILAILLFFFITLIPIEFYILGDGYGYGIKGICYRYQVSSLGDSFIPLTSEISYVTSGLISGKSAYAIMIWVVGALLFGNTTLMYWYYLLSKKSVLQTAVAAGIAGSSLLFLISEMIQYGPFFSGSAGIVFPFALPLLLFLGYFIYRAQTAKKN